MSRRFSHQKLPIFNIVQIDRDIECGNEFGEREELTLNFEEKITFFAWPYLFN
jgi:hypothetical protein